MKILSIILLGYPAIPIVHGTDVSIPQFHTSFIRSLASETCIGDMTQIQTNANLAVTLESSLEDFSSDIYAWPENYCTRTTFGDRKTALACIADFERFTPMYRTMCLDAEAEYFPVSLFMHCYNEDIDIEMELTNIPTCLAYTCDSGEISRVVARLLSEGRSVEYSDSIDGLSCNYYHRMIGAATSGLPNLRRNSGFGIFITGAISFLLYVS